MIAIDPSRLSGDKEKLINEVLEDIKQSAQAVQARAIRYPGERNYSNKKKECKGWNPCR